MKRILITGFVSALLTFLLFSVEADQGGPITHLETLRACERFTSAYTYALIWVYSFDKTRVNERIKVNKGVLKNEENKDRLSTRSALEQVFLDGSLADVSQVRVGSINRLEKNTLPFLRRHHSADEDALLFFFKGNLIEVYPYRGVLQASLIENMIKKVFFEESFYKKRARYPGREKKRRYHRHSCNQEECSDCCSYSCPRFGVSFGWGGMPCWDWPGYWYGRRWGWGGCGMGMGCSIGWMC